MSALFSPLKLRDTEFTNRVWVSPMCHYMATDGHVGPWHSAHLGALALTATALLTIPITYILFTISIPMAIAVMPYQVWVAIAATLNWSIRGLN